MDAWMSHTHTHTHIYIYIYVYWQWNSVLKCAVIDGDFIHNQRKHETLLCVFIQMVVFVPMKVMKHGCLWNW